MLDATVPGRWTTIAVGLGLLVGLILVAPLGMLWMLLHPPGAEGSATPDQLGLSAEEVRLTTSDGVELDAWIVEAEQPTSSALVVTHGYPADKADVLPAVAFLAGDHHLVLLDHRGLGKSEGSTTLGIEEPRDVHAGIEAARTIDGVEEIGLLGFSMGAAAAIQAGAEADVGALVAQAPYAALDELADDNFGWAGPLAGPMGSLMLAYADWFGLDAEQARPIEDIPHLDAPALLIHGSEDTTIPPDHSRRLAEAGDTELWVVHGRTHGATWGAPDWEDRVGGFFAESLG